MGIKFMIKKSALMDINKSMGKDKLDALKKEVIAILEKQETKEYKKAIEYIESLEDKYSHLEKSVSGEWIEKAGYGVGTVRIWKGKKYKKVSASPTRWVRVFDKEDRGAKGSMTKLINKVKACATAEELYQFCISNHSLFQDNNGVDLPIMDKLRAAVNEQGGKIERGEVNRVDPIKPEDKTNDKSVRLEKLKKQKKEWEDNLEKINKRLEKNPDSPMANADLVSAKNALADIDSEMKRLGGEVNKPTEKKESESNVSKKFKTGDIVTISSKAKTPNLKVIGSHEADGEIWIETENPETGHKENYNEIYLTKDLSKESIGKEKDKTSEKESESEKHQNRSDAMKGNKNAYKGKAEEIANKKILSKEDMLKKPLSTIQKYANADVYDIGKFNSIEDALNDSFETYKGSIDLGELTENELSERVGKEWAKKQNHDVAREIFKEYNDGKLVPNDKGILEPNKKSTKENNQKVSLNSYEPSESANIDEKEPISTNMKSGENEVTMPYSKELNEEIKSLNNGVSKEYDREFISKPYYSNGNLVSTDGRRMKVIKVGELDGIPDNSFVDVTSSKDGIKIKKIEMKNFDGEDYKFPAYNRVIPDGNNLKVTTDNAALKNKIKEMMKDGSIDKKVNRIAIEFKNGSAYIDGTKIGDASDMPYENISINANYLLDGISGKDSILMLSDDPNKALTISTATTTNVIMPMQGDGSVPDYESGRNAKKESDNVKSEIKNRRKEELEGALKRYQEILKPETVDKLIKTVNDKGTKDHEGIIKNSYEAMIRAEKQLENPKSNYEDEFTNPYGIRLVAASRINPEFRTALVNMAKEYGLEIKKSIFDFIDFDVDDSEDEELEPDFEDEDYSDYDASQPDLFNTPAYKVSAALDSVFGCR